MGCISSKLGLRKRIQRSFINTLSIDNYSNPVFGVPLINVLCSDKFPYVAKIVVECVEFIERDENITKDVYKVCRAPSDKKKIDKLKRKVFGCECARHMTETYLIRSISN